MGDLFDADEVTDQLPLLAEDQQDPKGLPRLLQFGDCASAINGLFQQALTATGAKAFDGFLDFVRNFSQLSVYNAMLVRVQWPGVVATRRKWLQHGRVVIADAIPIVILQPFGPVLLFMSLVTPWGRRSLVRRPPACSLTASSIRLSTTGPGLRPRSTASR